MVDLQIERITEPINKSMLSMGTEIVKKNMKNILDGIFAYSTGKDIQIPIISIVKSLVISVGIISLMTGVLSITCRLASGCKSLIDMHRGKIFMKQQAIIGPQINNVTVNSKREEYLRIIYNGLVMVFMVIFCSFVFRIIWSTVIYGFNEINVPLFPGILSIVLSVLLLLSCEFVILVISKIAKSLDVQTSYPHLRVLSIAFMFLVSYGFVFQEVMAAYSQVVDFGLCSFSNLHALTAIFFLFWLFFFTLSVIYFSLLCLTFGFEHTMSYVKETFSQSYMHPTNFPVA
ncbi:hypothetical protein NEAUS03_1249 [Nematocida ausubeli]|nr:hypothetical protein NEAUS03_1249 [Nematocida ausubeli]